MYGMFNSATEFNQDISAWNVSSVTDMYAMFAYASSFNQDISAWKVSSVTHMGYMFSNAVLFNKNLWTWQLKSGEVSVTDMFYLATAARALGYNTTPSITQYSNEIWRLSDVALNMFQPRTKAELQSAVNGWIDGTITADSPVPSEQGSGTYGAMNTWDVSLITDMSSLFEEKQNFNEDISNWNVSNVTDMYEMFYSASAFNQDISNWCVTTITSEPDDFSTDSPLSESNTPVWGTCPSITAIPDANFEKALIGFGLDSGEIDGQVLTANINGVTGINLDGSNISDLTGIEGFTALEYLRCDYNQLTRLDVSQNTREHIIIIQFL